MELYPSKCVSSYVTGDSLAISNVYMTVQQSESASALRLLWKYVEMCHIRNGKFTEIDMAVF